MASGQQWSGLSKAALPSTAALLEVFRSADAFLKHGNAAGCVLQLVRVTAAAAEEPVKFGVGHGESAAAAWAAGGGTAVCASGTAFPQVLFERWLAVLQQAAARLPYRAENWQTVLTAISEARQKLEGSCLSCGPCGAQVEQLVAARLAACQIQDAAGGPVHAQDGAAAAAAAAHQLHQQPAAGGRSRRRAAVAAHAAFAVAAAEEEGAEEEEQAVGTGMGRRKPAAQQQQQQAGSPGSDLENQVGPGGQPAAKPAAGKRSGTAALDAQQKLALQPTQAAGGSSKRLRM
ncbi:hypothetical protein ABPG75_005662 [Micractinium tetrahymenae]